MHVICKELIVADLEVMSFRGHPLVFALKTLITWVSLEDLIGGLALVCYLIDGWQMETGFHDFV